MKEDNRRTVKRTPSLRPPKLTIASAHSINNRSSSRARVGLVKHKKDGGLLQSAASDSNTILSIREFTRESASHVIHSLVFEDNCAESANEDSYYCKQLVTTIDDACNSSAASRKQQDMGMILPMDQCIRLLEPHLAAFRQRGACGAELNPEQQQDADAVPQQLIRLVRYFPSRWKPIQRALIRPASLEMEVGLSVRVRLARALQARSILSNAEVDGLVASLHPTTKSADDHAITTISDQLQFAMSRLPTDMSATPESATVALRHTQEVLILYCQEWRNSNTDTPPSMLLSMDRVVQLILECFSACALTNGIDECYHPVEHKLVDFLIGGGVALEEDASTSRTRSGGNSTSEEKTSVVAELTQTLMDRIRQLCTPPLVDSLSTLHVLLLGRFLSYISSSIVETLFATFIIKCAISQPPCGLSTLPKLMAIYLHLIVLRLSSKRKKENSKEEKYRAALHNFEQNLRKATNQMVQELYHFEDSSAKENESSITNGSGSIRDENSSFTVKEMVMKMLDLFLSSTSLLLTAPPLHKYGIA